MTSVFKKIPVLIFSLAACTAEFGLVGVPNSTNNGTDQNTSDPTQNPNEPGGNGVVICDPFSGSGSTSAEFGLRGFLFSDQNQGTLSGSERATRSSHYVQESLKVAELELSNLNVPGRRFNTGFPMSNGSLLTVGSGNATTTLVEWFAFSLSSQFVLKPGVDQPGLYQFAIISDDGATLKVKQPADQNFSVLIDNEGLHPQKLKVSQTVLDFQTGNEKYPMKIEYFQGPREHIAVQILMRKVANSNSASLDEPLNGSVGNDFFYNTTVNPAPSTPTQAYNELLGRGWKPLAPENFLLLGEPNRCAN